MTEPSTNMWWQRNIDILVLISSCSSLLRLILIITIKLICTLFLCTIARRLAVSLARTLALVAIYFLWNLVERSVKRAMRRLEKTQTRYSQMRFSFARNCTQYLCNAFSTASKLATSVIATLTLVSPQKLLDFPNRDRSCRRRT